MLRAALAALRPQAHGALYARPAAVSLAQHACAATSSLSVSRAPTTLAPSTFTRLLHASPPTEAKRLSMKQMGQLKEGHTKFLGTPPRDDEPRPPVPDKTKSLPGWGMSGGGAEAFTPTKDLVKRKTYFKRCRFFIKTLEYEQAKTTYEGRKGKIPAFRVGDVVELAFVTPENYYKEENFRGVVIKRQNRGLQSSFTLVNHILGCKLQRQWPLYSPHIRSMKIIERRRVKRSKLYYLLDRPPAEYTIK